MILSSTVRLKDLYSPQHVTSTLSNNAFHVVRILFSYWQHVNVRTMKRQLPAILISYVFLSALSTNHLYDLPSLGRKRDFRIKHIAYTRSICPGNKYELFSVSRNPTPIILTNIICMTSKLALCSRGAAVPHLHVWPAVAPAAFILVPVFELDFA